MAALEEAGREGLPVAGLAPNQTVTARMQASERAALSESASRVAYEVVTQLTGGGQLPWRLPDVSSGRRRALAAPAQQVSRRGDVVVRLSWAVLDAPGTTAPPRRTIGQRSAAPTPDWT